MKLLRKQGWLPAVTEHWNSFSKTRHDLYGFIDILAIREGQTLGLQVTTNSNLSARRAKMLRLDAVKAFLSAGNRVELWGWEKRKQRWEYRRLRFVLKNISDPSSLEIIADGWQGL